MNVIALLNQLAPSGIDFATDCSLESVAGARPTCTRVKTGFHILRSKSLLLRNPSTPRCPGLKRVPFAPYVRR